MARMTIKATYSLDAETVRALERIAKRWKVTKSEALRRAINAAMADGVADDRSERLKALDELQASVKSAGVDVDSWAKDARSLRRAWSSRTERGR